MDYKVFGSRYEAKNTMAKMRGWDRVRVAYVYWPDHSLATRRGNILVIKVGDDKYLREDGYVR